ncbi:MAG: glucosaminidase domain-containing protein [Gammaproteobacteria bacterium]
MPRIGDFLNSARRERLSAPGDRRRLREILRGREIHVAATATTVVVLLFLVSLVSGASRMPDFRQFEAGAERKTRFFEFLVPMIEAENARIAADRQRLLGLAEKETVGWFDRRWLHRLAGQYGVESPSPEGEDRALVEALLDRVDIVPLSLALAQAAKESGWGTSRFAREGYNLYGERCFDSGCGLVPGERASGHGHEVRKFESPAQSVASYLRNINTHPGYRDLRRARARLRDQGRPLSGLVLAGELQRYSERGQAYVEDIKGLIRYNELDETGA